MEQHHPSMSASTRSGHELVTFANWHGTRTDDINKFTAHAKLAHSHFLDPHHSCGLDMDLHHSRSVIQTCTTRAATWSALLKPANYQLKETLDGNDTKRMYPKDRDLPKRSSQKTMKNRGTLP